MPPKPTTHDSLPIVNLLTIDVEDYFQVSAFEAVSPPDTWDQRESRVEANTDRILGLLDSRGVKATFFVLGWVVERCPGLVKRIAGAGHELASHGYGHSRVYHQTRKEFRADIRKGKTILEDLGGEPVLGYRAPSYSISQKTIWAFDELVDAGFVYDSSVFPIRHDLYGMPDWPRFRFVVERLEDGNWAPGDVRGQRAALSREGRVPRVQEEQEWPVSGQQSAVSGQRLAVSDQPDGGVAVADSRQLTADSRPSLLELPITTLRLLGRNLPISGGGYFRLFPYGFTRWGLRRINEVDGQPFVFYLHPWEIDPGQPRMSGAALKSRFRHYLNLGKTEGRFERLLQDFEFAPIRDVVLAGPNVHAAAPLPCREAGGRGCDPLENGPMDDTDIRWRQRLSNYQKALAQLELAVVLSRERPLTNLEKQGLIQGFEFTHELAWNLMRDYFIFQGATSIMGSRDATREAFQKGLVTDGEGWMEMIRSRNQTSHTYNQDVAEEICEKIVSLYIDLFMNLERRMSGMK